MGDEVLVLESIKLRKPEPTDGNELGKEGKEK